MAHVIIACSVLLAHFLAFAILVYFREALAMLFDWLFLEVQPPNEGVIDLDNLRKLWKAPGDGAECIAFDDEGGWRLASPANRRADHR